MFAYCSNNPVMGCDPCGTCFHRWDFWNNCEKCGGKTIGDIVVDSVVNFVDACWSAIEVEGGMGYGLGSSLLECGLAVYRDFYVGIDDGNISTGSKVVATAVNLEQSWTHSAEKDGERNVCELCRNNVNAHSIIHCPNSQSQQSASGGFISCNSNGEVIVSQSGSLHVLIGVHFSISFNITQFLEEVFN